MMSAHPGLKTIICCTWLLPATTVLAQWGGPAKVTVSNVELRDLPASATLVGTVEPVTRSTIGSEIAGLVEEMPVRQGDFVRAGELICRLRGDTISLQLAEARERLKGFEATLGKWILEQERIQRLYGTEDAAEKEVYDTQAALDLARYTVAEQKAVIAQLENDLDKTEIRAPFSGFIIERHTEVGQWLREGGDVVAVADLATVLVRTNAPEEALPYIRVGDRASVKIEALDRWFEGRVRHVIVQGDLAARTFPVEIAVPNPGYVEVEGERIPRSVARAASGEAGPAGPKSGAGTSNAAGADSHRGPGESGTDPGTALLAGGMFARVTVRCGPPDKAPAVPKDAVVMRNGVEYVCMITPGQEEGSLMAIPVPVTTGLDIEDWIAVTSGNLTPGMRVVTKGNENILFPSPVVIVEKLGAPTERPVQRPPESPAEHPAPSASPPSAARAGS